MDTHEFNLEKAKKIGLKPPAKKYSQYDAEQLEIGIEEEFEHTRDPEISAMIAAVHLDEDKEYYIKLLKIMSNDDICRIANSIDEDIAAPDAEEHHNEIISSVIGELDDISESIKNVIFNLYRMERRGIDITNILDDNVSQSLRGYIITEIEKLRKHGTKT